MKQLPNTLIVVDEISHERLLYDDSTGLVAREGVATIPLPLPVSAPEWQQTLLRRNQLHEGHILVRDRMSVGSYVSAEDADWGLALSKSNVFVELCQILGARKVSVEMVQLTTSSETQTIDIGGQKSGSVAGKLSGQSEKTHRLLATMKQASSFPGGPPDTEQAKKLLHETGLDGDQVLAGLVQANSHGDNRLTQRKVSVNLSSEATHTLEAAARVGVPTFFSLRVNAKRILEEATKFTVEYRVSF